MGESHSTEPFTLNKNQILPGLFWGELADVLHLLVTASATRLQKEEGHFVADKVQPFVDRVRNLLNERSHKGWTREATAQVQVVFANALITLGEQTGGSDYLVEAIGTFREALKEYTRERGPLNWAATQNNLGNALETLGERESGTARLEEAVTAYRQALTVFSPETSPYYHQGTEQNLTRVEQLIQQRRQS
jgi:tetratricopeptide (TPR) repeat protein